MAGAFAIATPAYAATGPRAPDEPAAASPGDVVPPQLVSVPSVPYPPEAVSTQASGTVTLELTIDEQGAVTGTTVVGSGGPVLDQAAAAAVRGWRFRPALRAGQPVASRVRVPIRFDAAPAPPPVLAVTAPPPAATPPPKDDTVEVMVRGKRRSAVRAPSDFVIERDVLATAPHASAGDLLMSAPGVYVSRPEGDAIGHEIFLRGFDAEHGQDMEITVGAVPVNQPSHIHNHGYADMGFLIPEVVRSLRVVEGVYDPRQGDFAVAGSVDFDLGVRERGTRLALSAGSFGTRRLLGVVAPAGESEDTFLAFAVRTTDGFGANRAGQAAQTLGQVSFAWPHGWTGLLHVAAAGARANLAGVVRRDDVDAGRVGFTGVYPDASAQAQAALSTRAQTALTLEHVTAEGARTEAAVYLVASSFRLRENFTGSLQASRVMPDWRGRGDLFEQGNQAFTLGAKASHRRSAWRPRPWLSVTPEVGVAFRGDDIDQAQNLLQAPQNEVWDRRVDASVRGLSLGAYADVELRLGKRVVLRGGYRGDALTYDVDDRLAPVTSGLPGAHRTAIGTAGGPRASLEVRAQPWLTVLAAYGQGYRSPQGLQLAEGDHAPFTKVRAGEVGARAKLGSREQVTVTGTAFTTSLSQDLAFEPEEATVTTTGPTTRRGLAAHVLARPWSWALASVSVTGVRATLDSPPAASADNPTPAYRAGEAVPYVPPLVVRADLAWTPELRRPDDDPVRLRIGTGFTHLGARPLPYSQSSAPVTLLDATASVTWRHIALGIDVWNLFDRRYAAQEYAFVSNWGRPDVPSLLPARHITAGPPRTALATLTVDF